MHADNALATASLIARPCNAEAVAGSTEVTIKSNTSEAAAKAVEALADHLGLRELQPAVTFPQETAALREAVSSASEAQENGSRLRLEAADSCNLIKGMVRWCSAGSGLLHCLMGHLGATAKEKVWRRKACSRVQPRQQRGSAILRLDTSTSEFKAYAVQECSVTSNPCTFNQRQRCGVQVARAEDCRLLGEIPAMQRHYRTLRDTNRDLLQSHAVRASVHADAQCHQQTLSTAIYTGARLRIGAPRDAFVAAARNAMQLRDADCLVAVMAHGA